MKPHHWIVDTTVETHYEYANNPVLQKESDDRITADWIESIAILLIPFLLGIIIGVLL